MTTKRWQLFKGNGRSSALTKAKMPPAPIWRRFMSDQDFKAVVKESETRRKAVLKLAEADERSQERGESFRIDAQYSNVLNAVNASFHLRRPLLVTGNPGSGKTSLAYAVAYELKLGSVLQWPVNSRSTLSDVLYRYDAVARLQDAQLEEKRSLGEYIRLGPVGTAFLPSALPRVLLIDEIDKCDINLPNDLLNLFEEGRYEIPELVRCKNEDAEVSVRTADMDVPATIRGGRVFCREFPFIVMTSNGERDFPPAFLRRCLRLRMPDPNQHTDALTRIVETHLKRGADAEQWNELQDTVSTLIEEFKEKSKTADVATDQLLNLVYLLTREVKPGQDEHKELASLLIKGLNEES